MKRILTALAIALAAVIGLAPAAQATPSLSIAYGVNYANRTYTFSTAPVLISNYKAPGTYDAGQYRTFFQSDCNYVTYYYSTASGAPILQRATWNSHTAGNYNCKLILQNDGNVVIYNGAMQPIWATGTWYRYGPNTFGDYLTLQENGYLVVTSGLNSYATPIWASSS